MPDRDTKPKEPSERQRGAGIAYTDGKSLLLLKRQEPGIHNGTWGIPGGGAKETETFYGCALREVKEEIGRIPNSRYLGSFQKKSGRFVFQTYVALVTERFECKLSDEHSDYHWFPFGDLREVKLYCKVEEAIDEIIAIIQKKAKADEPPQQKHEGFAEFVRLSEMMGSTGDLAAGYTKGGADYQVQGDPSSMIRPKKRKKS